MRRRIRKKPVAILPASTATNSQTT
jgi:hypothetical protein